MLSLRFVALGLGALWLCWIEIAAAVEPQFPNQQPAVPAPQLPVELSAAARDYRIEIYGAFRNNRAEYDLRRKQGETLLAEWQRRGALPDEATLLVRWFDEARRASTRQQPLPALPNWNGEALELVPVPPRNRISPSASQTPLLRAMPQKRLRIDPQVKLTSLSLGILRPRESHESLRVLAATPEISRLRVVLAWQDLGSFAASDPSALVKQPSDFRTSLAASEIGLPKTPPLVALNQTTKPVNAEDAAELNTAELRARIRGYDKAWRALQLDLFSEEELTLERADALVTILTDLRQARRDLLLYQAIAPESLREELRNLPTLDELQKHLQKLLAAARALAAADRSLTNQQHAALGRAWNILLETAAGRD
jgi:hypothetical protein